MASLLRQKWMVMGGQACCKEDSKAGRAQQKPECVVMRHSAPYRWRDGVPIDAVIGTTAFDGTPGQLHYTDTSATRLIQANTIIVKAAVGLTRFGGHPETFTRGAADAEIPTTVFA